MPQKPDLRRAMYNVGNSARIANSTPTLKAATPDTERENSQDFRPGRAGKTNVTGYFPATVKKQLRLLAAEQETTIQDLLAQALNDFFAKHGKPEIAPVGDDQA